MPPIRKNANALTPYRIPIFLWSTVVNQLHQPVISVGRRITPVRAGTLVAVAISLCSLLRQAIQVGDKGVDLLFREAVVGHLRAELHGVRVTEPCFQGL